MSGIEQGSTPIPKAMIHRQILDAAATDPEATHEELATRISGASPRLVERILDTDGDPADDNETNPEPAPPTNTPPKPDRTLDLTPSGNTPSNIDQPEDKDTQNSTETKPTNTNTPPETETDSSINEPTEANAQDTNHESTPSSPDLPSVDELTEKQRQTLRAIQENPTATQAELAADFDVTPATVSAHANAAPGFEWSNRVAFVNALFDDNPTSETDFGTAPAEPQTNSDSAMPSQHADSRLDEIETRLTEISNRLETTDTATNTLDSNILHKVIHACMKSEQITTDEELQIIQALLE